MTRHTIDLHHPPARAASASSATDVRRLGPIALGMRLRATPQGAYVAPTASDYLAY